MNKGDAQLGPFKWYPLPECVREDPDRFWVDRLKDSFGYLYQGYMKDNQPDGPGILYKPDEQTLIYTFTYTDKDYGQGRARMLVKNGNFSQIESEGPIINGKTNHAIVNDAETQQYYEGPLGENGPHGHGKFKWLEFNCTWEGKFENGHFAGIGTLTDSKGH